MTCPVCTETEVGAIIHLDQYSVHICRQCGHGITDPLLSSEQLQALYDATYFAEHFETVSPDAHGFRKKIRQEEHRVAMVRKWKTGGRILDVGCGQGYFMTACGVNYDCTGFDVTENNREFIENKLGMRLVTGNFDELKGRASFDVITFWHSLEHFPDPVKELTAFSELLADDGLLIIDVPNHHSIDAYMEGEKWLGWDVPFHCHHFTRKSLELLLEKLNFQVLSYCTYHSGYVRDQLRKRSLLRPVARPLAKLFSGSAMALSCRKKNA